MPSFSELNQLCSVQILKLGSYLYYHDDYHAEFPTELPDVFYDVLNNNHVALAERLQRNWYLIYMCDPWGRTLVELLCQMTQMGLPCYEVYSVLKENIPIILDNRFESLDRAKLMSEQGVPDNAIFMLQRQELSLAFHPRPERQTLHKMIIDRYHCTKEKVATEMMSNIIRHIQLYPEQVNQHDPWNLYPITIAVTIGDMELIHLLEQFGADFNIQNYSSATSRVYAYDLVACAIESNNPAVLAKVLSKGIRANSTMPFLYLIKRLVSHYAKQETYDSAKIEAELLTMIRLYVHYNSPNFDFTKYVYATGINIFNVALDCNELGKAGLLTCFTEVFTAAELEILQKSQLHVMHTRPHIKLVKNPRFGFFSSVLNKTSIDMPTLTADKMAVMTTLKMHPSVGLVNHPSAIETLKVLIKPGSGYTPYDCNKIKEVFNEQYETECHLTLMPHLLSSKEENKQSYYQTCMRAQYEYGGTDPIYWHFLTHIHFNIISLKTADGKPFYCFEPMLFIRSQFVKVSDYPLFSFVFERLIMAWQLMLTDGPLFVSINHTFSESLLYIDEYLLECSLAEPHIQECISALSEYYQQSRISYLRRGPEQQQHEWRSSEEAMYYTDLIPASCFTLNDKINDQQGVTPQHIQRLVKNLMVMDKTKQAYKSCKHDLSTQCDKVEGKMQAIDRDSYDGLCAHAQLAHGVEFSKQVSLHDLDYHNANPSACMEQQVWTITRGLFKRIVRYTHRPYDKDELMFKNRGWHCSLMTPEQELLPFAKKDAPWTEPKDSSAVTQIKELHGGTYIGCFRYRWIEPKNPINKVISGNALLHSEYPSSYIDYIDVELFSSGKLLVTVLMHDSEYLQQIVSILSCYAPYTNVNSDIKRSHIQFASDQLSSLQQFEQMLVPLFALIDAVNELPLTNLRFDQKGFPIIDTISAYVKTLPVTTSLQAHDDLLNHLKTLLADSISAQQEQRVTEQLRRDEISLRQIEQPFIPNAFNGVPCHISEQNTRLQTAKLPLHHMRYTYEPSTDADFPRDLPEIHQAIFRADLTRVMELVNLDPSCANMRDGYGRTPLYLAHKLFFNKEDRARIMEILFLAKQACAMANNFELEVISAIVKICRVTGEPEVCAFDRIHSDLVNFSALRPYIHELIVAYGKTMEQDTRQSILATVKELLDNNNRIVNDQDAWHLTPLTIAVSIGCKQLVTMLIDYGAEVNFVIDDHCLHPEHGAFCRNTYVYNNLEGAVQSGNPDIVILLLYKGAHLNSVRPFQLAVKKFVEHYGDKEKQNDYLKIINYLCQYEAPIGCYLNGIHPLDIAIHLTKFDDYRLLYIFLHNTKCFLPVRSRILHEDTSLLQPLTMHRAMAEDYYIKKQNMPKIVNMALVQNSIDTVLCTDGIQYLSQIKRVCELSNEEKVVILRLFIEEYTVGNIDGVIQNILNHSTYTPAQKLGYIKGLMSGPNTDNVVKLPEFKRIIDNYQAPQANQFLNNDGDDGRRYHLIELIKIVASPDSIEHNAKLVSFFSFQIDSCLTPQELPYILLRFLNAASDRRKQDLGLATFLLERLPLACEKLFPYPMFNGFLSLPKWIALYAVPRNLPGTPKIEAGEEDKDYVPDILSRLGVKEIEKDKYPVVYKNYGTKPRKRKTNSKSNSSAHTHTPQQRTRIKQCVQTAKLVHSMASFFANHDPKAAIPLVFRANNAFSGMFYYHGGDDEHIVQLSHALQNLLAQDYEPTPQVEPMAMPASL